MKNKKYTGGRLLSAGTLALLVLLSWPAPLRADDTARARELYRQAEIHFKLGEFDRALPLYKQAYRTKPLPALLFNIAQCHRFLKQHERCAFFFERFLLEAPESPHQQHVQQMIEVCKKAEAAGARQPASQPVQPPPTEQPPQPVQPPPTEQPPPAGDAGQGKTRQILLWTGIGLSAALLITGAVTGVLAYDKSQTFKDPNTPRDQLQGLEDSGKALATTSAVTLSLGGVAAVGTLLVYLLYPEGPESGARVSLAPTAGGGALLFSGRF